MNVIMVRPPPPCYCMFCKMYDIQWRTDKEFVFGSIGWHQDRIQQFEKELLKMKELNAPKFLIDLISSNLKRRRFMLEVLKQEYEELLNTYYR